MGKPGQSPQVHIRIARRAFSQAPGKSAAEQRSSNNRPGRRRIKQQSKEVLQPRLALRARTLAAGLIRSLVEGGRELFIHENLNLVIYPPLRQGKSVAASFRALLRSLW